MRIKILSLKFLFIFVSMTAFSFFGKESFANNLLISNFEVNSMDESSNTITFSCDVSWENSWRTTSNYDSIWVFLKYSVDGGVTWSHASMNGSGTNPSGFVPPTNFEMIVPADEKGFFLQRTDLSAGNVTATNVKFVWDYAQDGLTDTMAMAANTINKVFGIEMVYAPRGAFYAGDGSSSSDYRFTQGSADSDPWYVQNEDAITTTSGSSDGYYYTSTGATSESSTGSVFLIPASFPKGYVASYYMKYELTEGQWVSFFNTLTNNQKSVHDITSSVDGGKNSDAVVVRNTIAWDSSVPSSDATSQRPDRPVSFISWPDLTAYADWAALRPITELEYEKLSRGSDISPVANELAWGESSTVNGALSAEITPDADEDGAEQIWDGSANINNNSLAWTSGDGRSGGDAQGQAGPLRVGIFAESSSTRSTSGAGYYGNMELSGNLYEMVVTVGRSEGRRFLGTHGDGKLSISSGYEGNATNLDWPGIDSADQARGVTTSVGSGYRGGDFQSSSSRLFQVSTRTNAVKDPDSEGYSRRYDAGLGIYQGGRLGRTAP